MIRYRFETWRECGREFAALGREHFKETDDGVEPRRPYALDPVLMDRLCFSGVLKIMTARRCGELVGYIVWQVTPDVESCGLIIAQMGPWFAKPGLPRVAHELWERSLGELKRMGVKMAFPHHRLQGRGANLGKFFRRQGAREIQHTYSLWIGE
jgi:hypothetical protein